MGIIGALHAAVDYLLSWVKISGEYLREQQPLMKKIKLLLLFNPLTTWLDTTHAMRLYMHSSAIKEGKKEATPASRNRIQQLVDTFHINMSDFEPSDINAYPTFEDFFVRHHKPGTVAESKKIWIKGEDFSITNLVMDKKIGPQFHDGPVASFRLSPQDYHRYHSPASGRIKVFRSMPRDYYDVDPLAIRSGVDILTRNARDYVVIETEEFGEVLFVAIGASQVGTVDDPSGKIYENLHMTRTMSNIMSRPSYSTVGFWSALGKSFRQMASNGWRGLKGGGWGQNGGEWAFRDGKCVYVHRMKDVGDHLTAGELLEVLGCGDEEGEGGDDGGG
ncbi:phosphatidylserine decarboxylase-domain-containing protein [Aspergillus falconensis]